MKGAVEFNGAYDNVFKKPIVKEALKGTLDHAIHDAENICKREAPLDTGNLRNSIHKVKGRGLTRRLKQHGAPYWIYVQAGTSKMSANPFVTRTANKIKPKLNEYVTEELERLGVM